MLFNHLSGCGIENTIALNVQHAVKQHLMTLHAVRDLLKAFAYFFIEVHVIDEQL